MKDVLKNMKQDIRLLLVQIGKNVKNEKALRGSFLIQIFGMAISNLSFFIIWIFFSQAVGSINGWGPLETFGMLSVTIFMFGLCNSTFGGLAHWYNLVPTGVFDTFMIRPKSIYLRVMTIRCNVSAIGDLIQGLIGIGIFLYLSDTTPERLFFMLALFIPSLMAHIAMLMVANCVIFWVPQAPSVCQALFNLALLPSTQPISLLDGAMRFIYLFIIPALLMAGLPIENFIKPDINMLLLAYGIGSVWLFLSWLLLSASIKRYESGNTIG